MVNRRQLMNCGYQQTTIQGKRHHEGRRQKMPDKLTVGDVAEAVCHHHTTTAIVRWTLLAANEVVEAGGQLSLPPHGRPMASQWQHHQVTPDQNNRRDNQMNTMPECHRPQIN
jgi:hypothetical protein